MASDSSPLVKLGLRARDLAVLPLLAGLLALNLWRLAEVPTNVTGDEVTFLNDILKIAHSPDQWNPMTLMGDGSKAGIALYYLYVVMNFFTEDQAILGMRVASVILGIVTLGVFYVYLRSKVSRLPALCAVLLLGTNYVYLNLSRATWMADGKGLGLIFGLLSFWLVERGTSRGKLALTALGGVAGGITLYSYFGTVLLPVAPLLYFVYLALRRRLSLRGMVIHGATFAAIALIVFLPNLRSIRQDYDTYTLRSRSVYVATAPDAYYREMDAGALVAYQIGYTLRGFLLFDPAVTGTGPENGRYSPVGEAPVDAVTEALFFLAIVGAVFVRRRDLFQPIVAFVIMLVATQMMTVYPPNYSRGVFLLPFMYLLIAVLLDAGLSARLPRRYTQAAVVALVIGLSMFNVRYYFEWGSSPEAAEARQPAIEYSHVPLWIDAEKKLIAAGDIDLAITMDDWQNILRQAGRQAPGGPDRMRLIPRLSC